MTSRELDAILRPYRDEVELLRRRGLSQFAAFQASVIADIETAFHEWELEALTLHAAAEESGYAYSTLQQKVAKGDVPNAGEPGKPLIRRRDLPRLASSAPERGPGKVDLAQEILDRRNG